MHTHELRVEHLPGKACHDINRVRAADTTCEHPEATGVRRMRIRPDHHATRKCVFLENDLMDDPGAWAPETESIAGAAGAQKVVDLGIGRARGLHVRIGSLIGLDQMVAVDRRRDRSFIATRLHELEQRHLRRRVLHRDAIGAKQQIGVAGVELLSTRIIEMTEQDLLGVGERSAEAITNYLEVPVEHVVGVLDELGCRGEDTLIRGFLARSG